MSEDTIARIMRALSVAFPTIMVILLALLVHAVSDVSATIKQTVHDAKPQSLPAGIYVCNGDACVVAGSK